MRSIVAAAGLAALLCGFSADSLHAAPARPDGPGKTFMSGGATIWYDVRGLKSGTPLVVVNGGPGFDHGYMLCSDVWDRLATRRPVVLYDQRGTGRAGALEPAQSCTLSDQVQDLEALRVDLGVEQMDLIGHSWGGFLIMAYAVAHPDRVNRLVLVDSAEPKFADTKTLSADFYPELAAEEQEIRRKAALGEEADLARVFEITLHMRFVSEEKRREFMAQAGSFRYEPAIDAAVRADIANMDLTPLIAALTMPTLVVTGRYDLSASPGTAWRIHQLIPGSRFAVFEHSGHVPFFEEPDTFVERVGAFLDER